MYTRLQAVNYILSAIGEDEVSSLDSGLPDAEAAERFLDRTRLRVLAVGWHSNTDREFKLLRNPDGYIKFPGGALRIDASKRNRHINITIRPRDDGMYLYDLTNQTYVFTQDIYVEVTWAHDFETLPYELARYIAVLAAVDYQKSEMSSVVLDQMIKDDMQDAWAAVMDAETEVDDTNPLTHTAHGVFVSGRNHRLYGQ